MEIVTTLGYLLFLTLPLNAWSTSSVDTKNVCIEKVSKEYLTRYHCKEAELMIAEDEQNNEVKFLYKCKKFVI